MTLRIEAVSCAAASPVSMLHRACFPEDPWDPDAVAQIMRMPGFIGRVGWKDDLAVGFLLALHLGNETEILSIGVVPGHRRSGVGSALLDALSLEAARRAGASVVLEVAVDNAAARALYAASGFTVVGYRRNYYRRAGRSIDGLILRRALATAPPQT
jgi:[ribosomal protein S18]-alanine N-acetyltransferase